ncbi:MAG: hypothetical protein ACLUKN_09500 [Bacilli bacterium]
MRAQNSLSKLTSEELVSIFEEMQFSTSIAQTLAECILTGAIPTTARG